MIDEIKREIDIRVNKLVIGHITNLLTDCDDICSSDHDLYWKYKKILGEYIDSKLSAHNIKKKMRSGFYIRKNNGWCVGYDKQMDKIRYNICELKNRKNKLKKQLIFSGLQNKT